MKTSYDRIAVLSDHPRLLTAYNVWYKLHRVTHDSWPALFGTKEHKRRVKRWKKMCDHFRYRVKTELGVTHYDVRTIKGVGEAVVWNHERRHGTLQAEE
jgi:hypothetical protein